MQPKIVEVKDFLHLAQRYFTESGDEALAALIGEFLAEWNEKPIMLKEINRKVQEIKDETDKLIKAKSADKQNTDKKQVNQSQ